MHISFTLDLRRAKDSREEYGSMEGSLGVMSALASLVGNVADVLQWAEG